MALVKISSQLMKNLLFVGSWQRRHDHWTPANADASARADKGAWVYNTRNQDNFLFKGTYTLSSKALVKGRSAMNIGGGSDKESFPNADPNRAGYVDQATGLSYGWFRADRWNVKRDALVGKVDFSYYAQNFLGGTHDLKTGWENEQSPFENIQKLPESMVQQLYNNQPYRVVLYNEPIDQKRNVTRNSLYLQDQWTIKTATLSLGARIDKTEGWTPPFTFGGGNWFAPVTFEGKRNIVNLTTSAPRLGISWGIKGKHKWVLRATYGRWYDRINTELVPTLSGGSQTYEWIDSNGDRRFQWGEQGKLISTSLRTSGQWDPSEIVDPNLKNPYTDSFNVGFEWQVVNNFSLAVTGIYKQDKDMWGLLQPAVPETAYFPIQAVNPLNGQPITIYALDQDYRTVKRVSRRTNLRFLYRNYKGVEIVAKRWFDRKFQAQVSVNIGRAEGNQGTNLGAANGTLNYSNPNYRLYFYGPTDLDSIVQLKVQGTYVLPHSIHLSGHFPGAAGGPGGHLLRRQLLLHRLPGCAHRALPAQRLSADGRRAVHRRTARAAGVGAHEATASLQPAPGEELRPEGEPEVWGDSGPVQRDEREHRHARPKPPAQLPEVQ